MLQENKNQQINFVFNNEVPECLNQKLQIILYILERNCNEKFINEALTKLQNLESVLTK